MNHSFVRVALVALAFGLVGLVGCEDQPLPRIDAIVPAAAAVGEVIDLVGEGFEGKERQVSFAGRPAEVRFWQPGRVRVVVPDLPPGLTRVVLTVDGEPSPPFDFDVTD